jgi:acyl-CoA dehydrogenase family protein 9
MPYEKRMRDFRVTTVFEGTSEIHSIYPALYLIRVLGKKLKDSGRGRIGQAAYLIKESLRMPAIPSHFKNSIMKKAARTARRNTRAVRRMVHLGLLLHGKKIVGKEFFLRRVTYLSLDLFGLLAILAWIEKDKVNGVDIKEKLHLLDYYLYEVENSAAHNRRFFAHREESLHSKVFKDILARKGDEEKNE